MPLIDTTMFEDVADFQFRVLSVSEGKPHLLSRLHSEEQLMCLLEEMREIADAVDEGNLVGIADGLADLVYFALGFAYKLGLPFDEIWQAVHAANMEKKLGMTKRGHEVDAVKPEGWIPPEDRIRALLA